MPGVSIETLRRWRNHATSVGHLTPLKQPGRPKKHSPREIRLIRQKATQNPSFSINRLKIECGVDACHKTMVKILLIFIEGGINGQKYKQILNRYVLPHLLDQMGEDGASQLYQDDGTSCHDCQEVIDFCSQKGIRRPY